MRPGIPTDRPDLLRARAVLDAMRNPAGKQVRTVVQAVAWIDKNRPGLTAAWATWVKARRPLKPSLAKPNLLKPNPPPLLA